MPTAESFEEFATSASPMLMRTAWLLAGDRASAEDLVQETLTRVFVRWRKRTPIDNPAGYARTVLVRLHVAGRRRRSAGEVITAHVPERAAESDPTVSLALHAALATLDRRDQAVLVLRYFSDRSVADVAADLDLSESAVRTRTSRASARLRARLGPDFLAPSSLSCTDSSDERPSR